MPFDAAALSPMARNVQVLRERFVGPRRVPDPTGPLRPPTGDLSSGPGVAAHAFFETAAMLMGVVEVSDDDILHLSDNRAGAALFGRTPAELRGKWESELGVPPETRRRWVDHYRECARLDQTVRFEFDRAGDNGRRWYSAVVCPAAGPAGAPPRFSYVIEDITERRRAEFERQEQQLFADQVVDAMGQGLVVTDNAGRFAWVNPAFARMLGYSQAELNGSAVLDIAAPEDHPAIHEARVRRRQGETYSYTIRMRHAQGHFVDVLVTAVPRWADGQFDGAVVVITDLTERIALERLREEFVAIVSHELRTPLTSIRGFVELFLEGTVGDLSPEQREFMGIIKNNADRMASLVDDLLDLARLEAGRVELTPHPIDMARLIRAVAESMRPQFDRKSQRLSLELPADLPPAVGDVDRVTQILTNLLSNAHKYTPAGGSITVSLAHAGDELRVAVIDTGIGLSPDEQAQLFTKWFRARREPAHKADGTGLGLTIARLLLDLHGGSLSVESELDVGSTFTFTLPAAEDRR